MECQGGGRGGGVEDKTMSKNMWGHDPLAPPPLPPPGSSTNVSLFNFSLVYSYHSMLLLTLLCCMLRTLFYLYRQYTEPTSCHMTIQGDLLLYHFWPHHCVLCEYDNTICANSIIVTHKESSLNWVFSSLVLDTVITALHSSDRTLCNGDIGQYLY